MVTADLKVRDGGWELLNESEDITTMSHDTKAIRFYMGVPNKLRNFKPSADDFSRLSFEDNYAVNIPAGGNQQFEFKVDRGAFNTALSEHIAFNLTLTFAYN